MYIADWLPDLFARSDWPTSVTNGVADGLLDRRVVSHQLGKSACAACALVRNWLDCCLALVCLYADIFQRCAKSPYFSVWMLCQTLPRCAVECFPMHPVLPEDARYWHRSIRKKVPECLAKRGCLVLFIPSQMGSIYAWPKLYGRGSKQKGLSVKTFAGIPGHGRAMTWLRVSLWVASSLHTASPRCNSWKIASRTVEASKSDNSD